MIKGALLGPVIRLSLGDKALTSIPIYILADPTRIDREIGIALQFYGD